jgi:hypothetical protein
VQQVGSRLELQAVSPRNSAVLVVGRAEVPLRDRDGFVALKLDPGWDLQRRTYEQRALTHLYFASPAPLEQLIARAGGSQTTRRPLGSGQAELPGIAADPMLGQGDDSMGSGRSGRAIALQVIPYSEANTGEL